MHPQWITFRKRGWARIKISLTFKRFKHKSSKTISSFEWHAISLTAGLFSSKKKNYIQYAAEKQFREVSMAKESGIEIRKDATLIRNVLNQTNKNVFCQAAEFMIYFLFNA